MLVDGCDLYVKGVYLYIAAKAVSRYESQLPFQASVPYCVDFKLVVLYVLPIARRISMLSIA
jgi:hypothetical protein